MTNNNPFTYLKDSIDEETMTWQDDGQWQRGVPTSDDNGTTTSHFRRLSTTAKTCVTFQKPWSHFAFE